MEITVLLVLEVLLVIYMIYSLIKFCFFFFVKYDSRKKLLDSAYDGKTGATNIEDIGFLIFMAILLILLVVSGKMQFLSFATGFMIGMTLIQNYFHSFSQELPKERMPKEPLSAIKYMSYAIEDKPSRAWKQLLFIGVIIVWLLYTFLSQGF
ncbi:hypothetical protein KQY27_05270 [Methanobrevibacter sp. TMH8]|uniref:hypothetical protein n=1 Tax=Methanobrevibacter sp. TMH8 TaxID=2848611 RepID=UPI001CC97E16|nr:hypothetical protein [Methanobrevibacter sp. TMH8]MBZ9570951.1 hypothetical protein [Methanobrevibacter sp. TMH8]